MGQPRRGGSRVPRTTGTRGRHVPIKVQRPAHRRNTIATCRTASTRALFEVHLEIRRQPRLANAVARIASRAGLAGAAAGASPIAEPRSLRMIFADPSAIVATLALHRRPRLPGAITLYLAVRETRCPQAVSLGAGAFDRVHERGRFCRAPQAADPPSLSHRAGPARYIRRGSAWRLDGAQKGVLIGIIHSLTLHNSTRDSIGDRMVCSRSGSQPPPWIR